jgi:sec-independent protein translocase protein TatB
MPTIGWFEILIIIAVSIVVIGPKDFPFMLKKVGTWIGSVKRYIGDIQKEVADLDIGDNENINTDSKNKENKENIKTKDND